MKTVAEDIQEAVKTGDAVTVRTLLARNPDSANTKDNIGFSPLHLATNKDVAEMLLAYKADVNAKNIYGDTPLHIAAIGGRKEVIEVLLAHKADVNAENIYGQTPLHVAQGNGVARLLYQYGDKEREKLDFGPGPFTTMKSKKWWVFWK